MRKAAVLAGLVPDNPSGHFRLSFVTEGEASLHFCIQNGLLAEAMEVSSCSRQLMWKYSDGILMSQNDSGVVIVDAGSGTINISSYSRNPSLLLKESCEKIAPPQCLLIFITLKIASLHSLHTRLLSRLFFCQLPCKTILEEYVAKLGSSSFPVNLYLGYLIDSPYLDDLDHIVNCFDKTTNLRFGKAEEPQYVKFGSIRDNDESHNIRFGQLKLIGSAPTID